MSPSDVDTLLDRLLTTTEELRDSARAFGVAQASDLMVRRGQILSSLASPLRAAELSGQQRDKLERAMHLGDEARQELLIHRETSRRELQESVAGRRVNESFKPYRPDKSSGLNIKL
jgi:hypothetical protein